MSHDTMPNVPVEDRENSGMTAEDLGGVDFLSDSCRLIKTLLPDTGDDLLRTEP